MSRKKSKIDVGNSKKSEGLSNPFAMLSAEGLPPGELNEGLSKPAEPVSKKREKPSKKGRVVLRKETSHRGGKAVIVVSEFAPEIPQDEIESIARRLRKACGCGGAVKEREVEIQGDQPGRVREFLAGLGFQVAGVR